MGGRDRADFLGRNALPYLKTKPMFGVVRGDGFDISCKEGK
jgi:hypothetical protein